MRYTLERKREIIASKPNNVDVRTYCDSIDIAYSSYYKWIREINQDFSENKKMFVDVNDMVNEISSTTIDLEVSNIVIHVSNYYDENHLLKILNTLKKLW